jgi:hypothetical protein
MCTVSIVATPGVVRLVCNRDERLSRPAALPPDVHRTAARTVAIYPVDPQSGGTWIGVADGGFAAVLLNRTPPGRDEGLLPAASRGAIVPLVLACESLSAAIDAAARLDRRCFDPFELILLTVSTAVAMTGDGGIRRYRIGTPLLFTSSSLGDAVVEPARRALFDSMVARAGDLLEGQSRFHRHQWPAAPHISVLMERHDASTVSRTTVDLCSTAVRLRHEWLRAADVRGPARAA